MYITNMQHKDLVRLKKIKIHKGFAVARLSGRAARVTARQLALSVAIGEDWWLRVSISS